MRVQRWVPTTAVAVAMLGAAAGVASAAPAGLCDVVDADQLCQFHASSPHANIDLVFPANYPDQAALTGYMQQTLDDFGDPIPAPGQPPYALDATSTRYSSGTAPQDTTTSAVVQVYQNTGGPHPSTWYQAFNHDNTTNTALKLGDLFRPGVNPVQTLEPIVRADLTKQYGRDPEITPEAGADITNYQDFALTNDSLILFFDQDALRPAMEASSVTITKTALTQQLQPRFD